MNKRNDMKLKLSLLLAGICLSLLPACTESELADKDGEWPEVNLKPGEKAVMFTLKGTGSGIVSAADVDDTRADATHGSATRATGNPDEVTLPGEADIEKLDIYCFVAATVDAEFVLERAYHYSKASAAYNDFVLMASANGYKLGIGVPENDDKFRRFLIVANDNNAAGEDGDPHTAVASTTKYNDVLAWRTLGITAGVTSSLSSPFPMTSKVPKTVLMNDGSYTYKDEPFTSADLGKGIQVQMQRRVVRLDIDNPISEYFEVTGINVEGYTDYGLFDGTSSTSDVNTVYGAPKPCKNAASIPGAFYCYPGGKSDGGTVVKVIGNYLGAETTITTVGTQLLPNTRYIVRIHDSNHNLSATLEVTPWGEGDGIEAPVTPGTYAATADISVPYDDDANQKPYAYIDKVNRIIRVASDWLKYEIVSGMDTGETTEAFTPNPFLQLKSGTPVDTHPVGVILSDALKGRVEVVRDKTTGITTLQLIPTTEEMANVKGNIGMIDLLAVSPPATITFVTQSAEGALRYEEWTLIEDCFQFHSDDGMAIPPTGTVLGVSSDFPTLQHCVTSTQQTTSVPQATGITLTFSPYYNENCIVCVSTLKDAVNIYLETKQNWLNYSFTSSSNSRTYTIFPTDNNTGQTREAIVVVRKAVPADMSDPDNNVTTGGMEELRYRIVQPSITDATQTGLASSASIRLESMHTAEELSRVENTIYMNYGTYRDETGGGGVLTRGIGLNSRDLMYPFSLLSEGRKPVRVLIPSDCDWLIQAELFNPQRIEGEHGGEREPTPGNFIRQFMVTPNKTTKPRSVTFRIETYTNGQVKSTAYTLVQQPTKKEEGGGQVIT